MGSGVHPPKGIDRQNGLQLPEHFLQPHRSHRPCPWQSLRIFARNAESPLSTLTVEVLYEDAAGNAQSLMIGKLTGSASWEPSIVMPFVVNLLPLLPDERTAVAFRFTPDGGSWQIDDVYVDPYRRY